MTGEWVDAGELGVIVSNIDQRLKRWRSKVALVTNIGRFSGPRAVGIRVLADEIGATEAHATTLLEELVLARVLMIVSEARGRSPRVWAVNPAVLAWGSTGKDHRVPWTRDVHAVVSLAFAPELNAERRLRAVGDHMTRATAFSARPSIATRARADVARVPRAQDARKQSPARVESRLSRAQTAADALVVDLPTGVDDVASPPTSGLQEQRGEAAHRVAMKRAISAICSASVPGKDGTVYVGNGKPTERVEDLVLTAGVEQIESWLATSPKGLQVPGMLGWLENQAYLPNAELLAALDARPEPAKSTEADEDQGDEPAGPKYQEFTGYDDEPVAAEIPAAALESIRQFQEKRKPTPVSPADGTMAEATGGA